MPSKRKFTARFPTARIKKIMQLDEEIGKVAATVPPVVSRALELFLEDLLTKTLDLAIARGSKTITPSHMKHVIENEPTFGFAKKLVDSVPELKLSTQMSMDSTVAADGDDSNPSRNNNSSHSNAPKRGRPKKQPTEKNEDNSPFQSKASLDEDAPKRKRGRKRKGNFDAELNNGDNHPSESSIYNEENNDLPIDLSINNHRNSITIESP